MKTALPLQQHPHFGAALRIMGRPVRTIRVAGAAPVVTFKIAGQSLASRGPVWAQAACAPALAASPLRLINAETADKAAMRNAGFRLISTAAHVAEMDLTGGDAKRMAAMHGKWRNVWRRSQTAPVKIAQEYFAPYKHGWLLRADLAQQKAKRFRSLPHSLITAYAAAARDAVVVFVAYHDGQPVSGMLFLTHDPVATYHVGWNGAQGRKWGLHHRLLGAATAHFAGRGFARLDLGTVETDNNPGLARFKIGSGATVRALGGTWLRMPF